MICWINSFCHSSAGSVVNDTKEMVALKRNLNSKTGMELSQILSIRSKCPLSKALNVFI